ncbi:MAG: tellurite resistance TerB family protein [Chromatiaceae bacterium]
MANLGDLLGTFMQNTMSQSGQGRVGNVLQDLQSSLGGQAGGQAGGQGGMGGILGNVLDMAKSTLGNVSQNPVQAAGIGAVLGSILGGGGRSVSGAIKGGALAMLAGVAYKALTHAGQVEKAGPDAAPFSGGAVPLGMKLPQTPAEEQALQHTAELVIKGMINVAKADGQVSAEEIQRVVGKLKEAGMEGDAEAWILAELRKPLNLDAFVAEIPSKEVAAEVYAASLLAVEVDTPQERAYLTDLAKKAGIDGPVAQHIQRTVGVTV